jgi:hypothetical protein
MNYELIMGFTKMGNISSLATHQSQLTHHHMGNLFPPLAYQSIFLFLSATNGLIIEP